MKINNKFQQIMVFILPILIILGMCIPPTWTTLAGEEIRIKTKPIDPTDLFRGSYVSLSYEIENVSLKNIDKEVTSMFKDDKAGEKVEVYVQLLPGMDGVYQAGKVTKEKPNSGVYLKGTLYVPYGYPNNTESTISIDYHLDRQYASKEEAANLEKQTATKSAIAVLKVQNGNAVLTGIQAN